MLVTAAKAMSKTSTLRMLTFPGGAATEEHFTMRGPEPLAAKLIYYSLTLTVGQVRDMVNG